MATTITSGGLYMIMNINTRTICDLNGGNPTDGTQISGYYPDIKDGPNENQLWLFEKHDDYWQITNSRTKTAITMKDGSSDDGTPVVGSQPFQSDRQLWRCDLQKHPKLPAYFTFTNKASNSAMDLAGGNANDGTRITGFRADRNNPNQCWMLLPLFT